MIKNYNNYIKESLRDKMKPKSVDELISIVLDLDKLKKKEANFPYSKEVKAIIEIATRIIPSDVLFKELTEIGLEFDKTLISCLLVDGSLCRDSNKHFNGIRAKIIYKLIELIEEYKDENKNKLKDYDPKV